MTTKKASVKPRFLGLLYHIRYKYPAACFLLTFIFLFFSFFWVFNIDYFAKQLHPKIIYITAYLPHLILNFLGEPNSFLNGDTLVAQKFSLQIILDCCGIEPMAIFTFAVITYPSMLTQKLKGVLFALPVLFFANIFRIVSLYYVGTYMGNKAMDRLHLDVWQVLFILISIALFFFYIKWTTNNTNPRIIAS